MSHSGHRVKTTPYSLISGQSTSKVSSHHCWHCWHYFALAGVQCAMLTLVAARAGTDSKHFNNVIWLLRHI
eukprot:2410732-Pleurochrysis_carterae.AAC.1